MGGPDSRDKSSLTAVSGVGNGSRRQGWRREVEAGHKGGDGKRNSGRAMGERRGTRTSGALADVPWVTRNRKQTVGTLGKITWKVANEEGLEVEGAASRICTQLANIFVLPLCVRQQMDSARKARSSVGGWMRWYAIRALRVRGADGQTMRNKLRRLRRKRGRRWGTCIGRRKRIGGRYLEKGVGELAKGKACADTVRTARGARRKEEVIKGRVQRSKGKSYEGERRCAGARHDSGRRKRCKEETGWRNDSGQALKARKKRKQGGYQASKGQEQDAYACWPYPW